MTWPIWGFELSSGLALSFLSMIPQFITPLFPLIHWLIGMYIFYCVCPLPATSIYVVVSGINVWMRPANERWRCIVTSALIGWAHTQNEPCVWWMKSNMAYNLSVLFWMALDDNFWRHIFKQNYWLPCYVVPINVFAMYDLLRQYCCLFGSLEQKQ